MTTSVIFFVCGFALGIIVMLLFIVRDTSIVTLKSDQTIIKKDELEKLIKVYAFAAKKIDPDLADEFKE